MNLRSVLAVLAKGAGSLAVAFGFGLAGVCVLAPPKPIGSAGLHRQSFEGITYLSYGNTSGRGADFYFTEFWGLVGVAAAYLAVGGLLVWLGRRFHHAPA